MRKPVQKLALAALGAWMVPFIASRLIEDWHWGVGGFIFAYVLFFTTGTVYALISRRMDAWAYKAAVGPALAAGFVIGWSTMVHLSETENPAFLLYFGVLAIAAVGAALARLQARGLSPAVFAMAAAILVTWFLTQVSWSDTHTGPAWTIAILHAGAVLLFALCGLLFRHASLAQAK